MQAAQRNPDPRPLPTGWAEHFDPNRGIWYYINLGIANPRVSFVHPCDESPTTGTHPASAPLLQTTSLSTDSSSCSSSVSPTTSLRREHTRLSMRPLGSRESSTSLGSSRGRRATVAQQLYASSVTPKPLVSPAHSRRPSVSSSHNNPHLEDSTPGSSSSSSNLNSSAGSTSQTSSNTQQQRGRTDSTATGSSSSGSSPTSPPGGGSNLLDSHDPRNFFNYARLSRGSRRMTYDGPQPGPSGAQSAPTSVSSSSTSPFAQGVPTSQPQLPTPAHSASPSPSAYVSTSHNTNSASTSAVFGTLSGPHESIPTSGQSPNPLPGVASLAISPAPRSLTNSSPGAHEQAQAFYHSSVKPLQIPESNSAPPLHRTSQLPSPPTASNGIGGSHSAAATARTNKSLPPVPISIQKVDLKQKQPIRGVRVLPEPYKMYTTITEDESLLVMPKPKADPHAHGTFSGLTEDNLMVLPSHRTPAQTIVQATRGQLPQVPPTIDVKSIQSGDTQASNVIAAFGSRTNSSGGRKTPPHLETKLTRRNTVASSPTLESAPRLVVQQPRPIRPLTGVPVSLNLQVQLAPQSDCDAMYTDGLAEAGKNQDGKSEKQRKSFGFGNMSLFGIRAKEGENDGNVRDMEYDSRADGSFVLVDTP